MKDWTITAVEPFGVIAKAAGELISDEHVIAISELVRQNKVVVIRGLERLEGEAFPNMCRRFGEPLQWEFGEVNILQSSPEAKNYLYTNADVPFHWDGAFVGRIPRFIIFQCDAAPAAGSGGETLFTDTTLMLKAAPLDVRDRWRASTITYRTEKVVHYGGSFTSPVICTEPSISGDVIRFAEPVADLNPVELEITGIPETEYEGFISDMHERLRDRSACYVHRWETGDLVFADNLILLHGRCSFTSDAERKIRRVNIL